MALLSALLWWPDIASRYPQPSRLARVQAAGTLRVAVPVDPGIDHAAFRDMHHMLLREFANRLDVTLSLVEADTQAAMLDMLSRGEVDIAVPSQPVSLPLPNHLRAAPTYLDSQTYVVCNASTATRPALDNPLSLHRLQVSASDGYPARLSASGMRRAGLIPVSGSGTVKLLERVSAGNLPCTLAQGDQIARARQRLPNLRLGAAFGPAGSLGWLLRNTADASLATQVDRFFIQARKGGLIAQLREQERGLGRRFDIVDLAGFRLAMASKLPRYEADFRRAGADAGIDWRLLAALGYQESRWNPRAESPRGAGGLMMLTASTARSLGAGDRFNASVSIRAGSRYLAELRGQVGDSVPEPHRTWLMLAAYNVGPAALARVRQQVAASGGDANRWPEVRRALPTLDRGGRGWEPVYHVESVRRYFALMSAEGLPEQVGVRGARGEPDAGADVGAGSGQVRTRHNSRTG
jgi:membrane-bound lytic murein transglycosylase F